jgi:hypothetical protein
VRTAGRDHRHVFDDRVGHEVRVALHRQADEKVEPAVAQLVALLPARPDHDADGRLLSVGKCQVAQFGQQVVGSPNEYRESLGLAA